MANTFSYDNTLAADLDLVRFHLGDTNSDGNYLWDEEITAQLALQGSVNDAVIACIRFIITQLSVPDGSQDWNSVSHQAAAESWKDILKGKAREFGITLSSTVATSTISQPYRADSDQYTDQTRTETVSTNKSIYDGS